MEDLLIEAVRVALAAAIPPPKPTHPDMKRQRSRRRVAIERREVRRLKQTYNPWLPKLPEVKLELSRRLMIW